MTVTMTMEEYLEMKRKVEDYDNLVSCAKRLVSENTYTLKNDCYNYVRWLSQEENDCIIGQYGTMSSN